MARKTRALAPKKNAQKRGCANVPVPRDEVLVSGRVPKGCRFETGGRVLCTPAVAEKHGVIEVARKKQVPRGEGKKTASKKKTAKKASPKKASPKKKEYCYSPNSKLPYLKDSLEEGKRKKLKKGCKKDPETGKICCNRSWGKKRKKAVDGLDGLARFGAKSLGEAGVALAPAQAAMLPHRTAAPMSLALLDDGQLDLPDDTALAMLDESDDFDLAPPSEALPMRRTPVHLREPMDFALTYFGGTVLAAAGIAATYEMIDRMEFYDDKPVGRAAVFVGVGAVPAVAAWWLAEGRESADTIRTVATAWGISLTAIGVLGLIRELLLKQAGDTEDPEDRKSYEDAASHVPFYPRHEHDDDSTGEPSGGDDGEIVTDAEDDAGTSGPYPYPGGRHFR